MIRNFVLASIYEILQKFNTKPLKVSQFQEINLIMGPIQIKTFALLLFILLLTCNYSFFTLYDVDELKEMKENSQLPGLLELKKKYHKSWADSFEKSTPSEESMMSSNGRATLNQVMDVIAVCTQGKGIYLQWGSG